MFFRKRDAGVFNLKTDIHSHILPGIDDGSHDDEESLAILRGLVDVGLETIWLTPHVKENYYPNTYDSVHEAFTQFKDRVAQEYFNVKLEVAAEYYIGPVFMKLLDSGAKLLAMKDRYILVEVSMQQEPMFIFEMLYQIGERGYIPILAHPERYRYYYGRKDVYEKLKKHGCLFQLNLFSLAGYYGKDVNAAAYGLLKGGMYDFAATDIHNLRHLAMLSDRNIVKVLNEYNFKNDLLS